MSFCTRGFGANGRCRRRTKSGKALSGTCYRRLSGTASCSCGTCWHTCLTRSGLANRSSAHTWRSSTLTGRTSCAGFGFCSSPHDGATFRRTTRCYGCGKSAGTCRCMGSRCLMTCEDRYTGWGTTNRSFSSTGPFCSCCVSGWRCFFRLGRTRSRSC